MRARKHTVSRERHDIRKVSYNRNEAFARELSDSIDKSIASLGIRIRAVLERSYSRVHAKK